MKLTNQLYNLLLKRRMHGAVPTFSEMLFYRVLNKFGHKNKFTFVGFEVLEVTSIKEVVPRSLVEP